MRLVQLGLTALMLMGVIGGYAAALGWHDGVFLMLAWALLTFAWHLAAGVASYRAVMARPWPQVAPLSDDDWDD
jgi:phage shock protein PspC (stress-responsive transcriptional regulator)